MDSPAPGLPDLNALRFGHRAAWSDLYARLWDVGMKVVCPGLSGERHRQDREDIVQNAVFELHRKFFAADSGNQFASAGDVCGMMHTIASRRLADFHRRNYRRKEDSHADPALAEGAASAPAESGDEDGVWDLVAEGLDEPGKLWELAGRLKPPKPDLLADRFVLGLSASEVETKRGIPRGTVLSHWHASMKQLRTWLTARKS